MEKEQVHSNIKDLEAQLDLIRHEEKTQNDIFLKFRDDEREIDEAMKSIKEERADVSAMKDKVYDQLRSTERETRRSLKVTLHDMCLPPFSVYIHLQFTHDGNSSAHTDSYSTLLCSCFHLFLLFRLFLPGQIMFSPWILSTFFESPFCSFTSCTQF